MNRARAAVVSLVGLYGVVVVVGVFVADWATMTPLSDWPTIGRYVSVQLWSVSGCDPFVACADQPYWTHSLHPYAGLMLWITALASVAVVLRAVTFLRGKHSSRYVTWFALAMSFAMFTTGVMATYVQQAGVYAAIVSLGAGPVALIVANLVGLVLLAVTADEARSCLVVEPPTVPSARALPV